MYDGASAHGGGGRKPDPRPAGLTAAEFGHYLREAVRVAVANAVALLDTAAPGPVALLGSASVAWSDPFAAAPGEAEFLVRFEWTRSGMRVTTVTDPAAPWPADPLPGFPDLPPAGA